MGPQNARNLETQNEPGNLDEALDYLWISIKSMENPPPYLKEGARFPTKTKQVKECLRDWEENVLPSLPLRVRKACIAPVQHAERIIAKKVYEAMPATDYQHQEREDCISKAKILFITHIPAILHRSTHRRYGYVASIALSVVKDEYRVTHTPATGEDTGCRSSGNPYGDPLTIPGTKKHRYRGPRNVSIDATEMDFPVEQDQERDLDREQADLQAALKRVAREKHPGNWRDILEIYEIIDRQVRELGRSMATVGETLYELGHIKARCVETRLKYVKKYMREIYDDADVRELIRILGD